MSLCQAGFKRSAKTAALAYWVYRLNETTSFRSGWGPILKHRPVVLSPVPALLSNVPMMHPLAFLPASSSGDLCQEKPGVFNPVTETTPPFEKDSYRNWTEEKYGRFRRAEGERLLYKMAMRWKWEI